MSLQSPGIVKAANSVITSLKPEINLIKQFQFDLSKEVADYGKKVLVPVVDGGTAEQYNADSSNYGKATGSLDAVYIELTSQPKATIPITSADMLELGNASIWEKAAEAGRNSVSKAISKTIGGLFTTDNCQAGKAVMATVTKANLAGLRAKCKGRIADTVLLLCPDYYATMLSLFDSNVYGGTDPIQDGYVPRLYGFKAVVCAYDLPSGVKGAIVPGDGVATAVRPVAIPLPEAYPECDVVYDEETGFALTAMRHTDFNTAKTFVNITTLVGADLLRKADTWYISAS